MDLKKTEELRTLLDLSMAEKKAVVYIRELKPFQIIEIRLLDNKPGVVSVYRKETLREDFPIDMG